MNLEDASKERDIDCEIDCVTVGVTVVNPTDAKSEVIEVSGCNDGGLVYDGGGEGERETGNEELESRKSIDSIVAKLELLEMFPVASVLATGSVPASPARCTGVVLLTCKRETKNIWSIDWIYITHSGLVRILST